MSFSFSTLSKRYQNLIYYIEGEAISKRFRTVYNKIKKLELEIKKSCEGNKNHKFISSREFKVKFFSPSSSEIKVKKINQKKRGKNNQKERLP